MRRPMHILLVTPFSLASTGGITMIVRMLSREFLALGHSVSILVPGERETITRIGDEGASAVHAVYLRIPVVPDAPVAGLAAFVLKYPVTLWRLRRFLVEQAVDVVMVQYPLAWMSYLGVLRRVSNWKLIVTFQGNDAHDLHQRPWLERLVLSRLIKSTDCVTAVSGSLLQKVRRVFPSVPADAPIIPNGAAAPVSTAAPSKLPAVPSHYIVSIGQLIDRKGHDVLIRALGLLLRDHGLSVEAVIVGDGPLRTSLEELSRREGIETNVTFTGDQPNEVVYAILERSRFCVLPSRAEGFPLVVVEAMAAGRPVIASNIDGVPTIVRGGETGLLVPVDDAPALAKAIRDLWTDDARRQMMAARARDLASREFTWRGIASRYLELIESSTPPSMPLVQSASNGVSQ